MGDELLWLSPFDDCESQDAEPAQRRWRLAKLHHLQLSGLARRRVHAGTRWYRDGKSHRAGAFIERGAREFAKSKSRMDLFAAADSFCRRLFGPDVQYTRAAHGARD